MIYKFDDIDKDINFDCTSLTIMQYVSTQFDSVN